MERIKNKILSIVIILIGGISIKYYMYLSVRKDIVFLQRSNLYQYFSDYLLIDRNKEFNDYMKDRNRGIFYILNNRNIENKEGKFFLWAKYSNSYITADNLSFYDYLFTNKSILILPLLDKYGYNKNYLYVYNGNLFTREKKYNIDVIYRKYGEMLKCSHNLSIFPINVNQEKKRCIVIINNNKISIFNSNFSDKNIDIIKNVIREEFLDNRGKIYLIQLELYDIDNMKCMSKSK